MNSKSILKNISYSVVSNVISFLASVITVIVLPKVIGVQSFGYWQLYLLYLSFGGSLLLGWNDGILLRYGGAYYDSLNKQLFFSQFVLSFGLQLLFLLLIIFINNFIINDESLIYIVYAAIISTLFNNVKAILLFTLQATNRIKEYAYSTIFGRTVFLISILTFILLKEYDYKVIIYADILGKIIALAYILFVCRDLVCSGLSSFKVSVREAYLNIRVGINLMLSNIGSVFIVGSFRFGIERNWDISTFSKVSLALSFSNLLMIFINAVGVVLFPILKRTSPNSVEKLYILLRTSIAPILLGLLVLYYPLYFFIENWLPQYNMSLKYLSILFPIMFFEGIVGLLSNTFLKSLRKEKVMLTTNYIVVSISLLLTYIFTYVFKQLDVTVFIIVLLLALKGVMLESYLIKLLKVKMTNKLLAEFFIIIVFLVINWTLSLRLSLIIFIILYTTYLYLNKETIYSNFKVLKEISKK